SQTWVALNQADEAVLDPVEVVGLRSRENFAASFKVAPNPVEDVTVDVVWGAADLLRLAVGVGDDLDAEADRIQVTADLFAVRIVEGGHFIHKYNSPVHRMGR